MPEESIKKAEQRFNGTAMSSVLTLFAATYLNTVSLSIPYVIGVLFVDWTRTFESSKSETAWAISLCQGLSFLIGPLSASLCRHYGNRSTAMLGSVVATLGMATSAFSTKVAHMYATYGILSGVGFGIATTPSHNAVGEHFTKHRALALGVVSAVPGLWMFIFPYLLRAAADEMGWPGAHFIIAAWAAHGCVMAAMLPTQKTDPRCHQTVTSHDNQNPKRWWQMFSLCRDAKLIVFLIGNVFLALGGNTLPAVIVDYAADVNIGKADGASILSIIGIGGLCGNLLFLLVTTTKWLKGRSLYVFIAGCMLRCSGIALCASTSSVPFMSFSGFTYGCGVGMQICAFTPSVAEMFNLVNLPYYIGFSYCSLGIGTMFGPPITGWMSDALGSYRVPLYLNAAVCLLSNVFNIACAMFPAKTTQLKVTTDVKSEEGTVYIIFSNKLTETTRL